MTKLTRLTLGILATAVAATVTPVSAQDAAQPTWNIDGEVRLRGEYRQNFDLNSDLHDKDQFTLSRIRLGVTAKPAEDLSAFVQVQDSRTFGLESSLASNEKNLDLHQGWLKVEHLFGQNISAQFGRFEMAYGDQRLIGAFDWSNIGRAFDGGRLSLMGPGGKMDLFAARVRETATPRHGDMEDATFAGLYWTIGKPDTPKFDIYGLWLADAKKGNGEMAGETGNTGIFTYGGRFAGTFGTTTLKAEAAGQSGERNGDDHRAWAGSIYLEQEFAVADTLSGIAVGWAAASGDGKLNGESREFENLFPTNHPYYGLMDLFGWRNLSNPYLRLYTKPMGNMLLTLDVHRFDLQDEKGAWKDASGAVLGRDITGQSGKHVGDEIDLVFTFPIKDRLKTQIGLCRFKPGEFAKKVRGEDSEDFAYLSLTLPF